jgi:hypothetical protein
MVAEAVDPRGLGRPKHHILSRIKRDHRKTTLKPNGRGIATMSLGTSAGSDNPGPHSIGAPSSNTPTYSFDYLTGLDECPPDDAAPADGIFYACHEFDPPGESDFRTAAQRGAFLQADQCYRRANSILKDRRDVESLMKRYKRVFKFASEGRITPPCGLVKSSPSNIGRSHHSFWVCTSTSMHAIFNKKII